MLNSFEVILFSKKKFQLIEFAKKKKKRKEIFNFKRMKIYFSFVLRIDRK